VIVNRDLLDIRRLGIFTQKMTMEKLWISLFLGAKIEHLPTQTQLTVTTMTQQQQHNINHQHSLVVMIVDASPMAWGTRHKLRNFQDARRAAEQKASVGPCHLMECLESLTVLASAILSAERRAVVVVLGVADNECELVYPRESNDLEEFLNDPEHFSFDISSLRRDLMTGIAELTARAARVAETGQSDQYSRKAAMTSGLSQALCLINRFMVASRAKGAVSAMDADHFVLNRSDDDGVLGFIGSSHGKNKNKQHGGSSSVSQSIWSPRVLMVQASEDRSRDYNAFMNCAFAASKQNVVLDGCFLQAADKNVSSGFLEQGADLTGALMCVCSFVLLNRMPNQC
jgi:transcription initiation factor TFIIH subunit 3